MLIYSALSVIKQWMKTPESNGQTGYIYYPIEYTTKVLANVLTFNFALHDDENWAIWVKSVDKSKFLDGAFTDFSGDGKKILFDFISIGF